MNPLTSINNKKLLSTALQQIDDAVFITDTKGEILFVNSAFERMTGYKKEEVIGKTPKVISSGQHEDEFYDELWETILSGEIFRENIINKKKNGELFYADHTITPIKDEHGEVTHFVGSWKDITDKMRDQETRNDLINLISHELKTPITTVKTFTQLLLRRSIESGDEESEQFFSSMDTQINKLIKFINDLLDVSNIDGGKLKYNFKKIDFDKLVNTSIEECTIYIEPEKINLLGQTNAQIIADPHRIEQVINNLLTNAYKFSPNGKTITIKRQKKNGMVTLLVEDQGVGISKDDQKRIFDQYYRVKSRTIRSIPGVGLGLYISSEIIRRHNGKIWVDSEPGKGSVFGFSLPIIDKKQHT